MLLRILIAITLCFSFNYSFANKVKINGMAEYTKYRRSYYLAAIKLPKPSSDAKAILAADEVQHMVFKMTNDWSSRRFTKAWYDALLINNSEEILNQYSTEVQQFLDVAKNYMLRGDRVYIYYNGQKTLVKMNGTKVLASKGKGFFNLLLSAWIGDRPPSSKFKAALLASSLDKPLFAKFMKLNPTTERQLVTESWLTGGDIMSLEQAMALVDSQGEGATPTPVTEEGKRMRLEEAGEDLDKLKLYVAGKTAVANQMANGTESKIALEANLTTAKQRLFRAHLRTLNGAVLAKAKYPTAEQLQNDGINLESVKNMEAVVTFDIVVNRFGQLVDVKEDRPSRHEVFNDVAMDAIRAAEYPKAPVEIAPKLFDRKVRLVFRNYRVQ